MMWESPEEAFNELDKAKAKNSPVAKSLASYRDALIENGFTNGQAFRLVEQYSKYLFEWAIESSVRSGSQDFLDDKLEDDDLEDLE